MMNNDNYSNDNSDNGFVKVIFKPGSANVAGYTKDCTKRFLEHFKCSLPRSYSKILVRCEYKDKNLVETNEFYAVQ